MKSVKTQIILCPHCRSETFTTIACYCLRRTGRIPLEVDKEVIELLNSTRWFPDDIPDEIIWNR